MKRPSCCIKCLFCGALAPVLIGGCEASMSPSHMAASTTQPAGAMRESTTQPAHSISVAASTRPAEQRVTVENFAFQPRVLAVAAGTKVTWLNRDDVPHTATSTATPPAFNSGALDTDDSYSHVFARPGTYDYFCALHPKMTGKVIVK